MPYIPQEDRSKFIDNIRMLASNVSSDHTKRSGEINFIVSKLMSEIYGYPQNKIRYWQFNELRGALENCISEIYRRHVAPYEDKAIEKNGDL